MGGNAAEAHPCGFKWVTEAKANRGAKLIVVDPRYTRSASVADYYAPIRQGTDIAFLNGLINYCIANDKVQWEYTKNFTNATYLVKEGFDYQDGLFTGYDENRRDYDRSTWDYQIGPDGYVLTDDTLQDPHCVWNLLKKTIAVYTPEMVERICGTPKDKFLNTCPYCSVACGVILYSKGDLRRARRRRSCTSKAMSIIRPIAGRSAPKARR